MSSSCGNVFHRSLPSVVFFNEQMAKATEQEEDSKKKIVALDKEIARVQEQKVSMF
jgi:hypothetical protein